MKNILKYIIAQVLLFLAFTSFSQTTITLNDIRVNQQRIEKRIFELSEFGKDSSGKTNRIAYTKGDREGRAWFIDLMKKAGLEVITDNGGNIIGRRKGKNPSLKPIAFGSHLDMVPYGGNYDGCVGSICALEIVEVLNEQKIITNHPLEVIIFSNEEGGTVGSSIMAGSFNKAALKSPAPAGLTVEEGINAIGGNTNNLEVASRKKDDLAAFIELHIEQGAILEKENIQVGIVEGIVGIEHWDVTIEGMTNHAGTTPMNMRHDALLAAARLIIALNEVVTSYDGNQVGTIGKISAQPGAYNVIPGKVVLGMEIRDLSAEKMEQLFHDVEKRAADIEKSSGTKISFKQLFVPVHPALTDKSIQDKIVQASKSLGLTYKFMQSGAGHDAQEMSQIVPAGMIFVPSVAGISHSPKEFTKATDMANGGNVLLQAIFALDK